MHKDEGIVGLMPLQKERKHRKMNTKKYSKQIWQNNKKKQKFNDVEDNKENISYNSYDPLASSSFMEYNNNNNSLTWSDKNNSSTEYSGKDKEATQKPSTSKINLELMLDVVPHYAPTPDTVIDNMEINMSNTEVLAQTPMECFVEEGNQMTMGPSLVMNDTEMEMIESTEKDSVILEVHMTGALDIKNNMVTQQDSLGPTSNVTVQSNEHLESHLSETAMDATKPGDIE
ncbi:7453_t:CDS:2 [Gigaspora margarita]|uniref:7453_t:CDS:1 n=1 Tax=Gigaspora margarita TaxID=4874 RepID=A0ABN7VHV6_GIGMA|nr:7453_t:CDS:2 [Gigaspora margarita]